MTPRVRKLPIGWWVSGEGWCPTRGVLDHCLAKCAARRSFPSLVVHRVVIGSWLYVAVGRHIGHVRLFGYGVGWKDTRVHRPLWSDRERVYRQFRVGPWLVTPLPRGERGIKR